MQPNEPQSPQQPQAPQQSTPEQQPAPEQRPAQQSPLTRPPQAARVNPLNAMREGETFIFEIHRHPIGLISTYIMLALVAVVVGVISIGAPVLFSDVAGTALATLGAVAGVLVIFILAVIALIAHKVYYDNLWILTSDSLTQVTRGGLFNRQSSQLGLDNLEDVTVKQQGILPHIFNYGTLHGQTAGEHSKFIFPYCPDPNGYARKILDARELFEQGHAYSSEAHPIHK